MIKIIQFPNQKENKRKIIRGKILGKRITAEEIELKMNEYSEVFQCTKVGNQIGLKCKNCDAYMQIPVEVFISRKIKCVVCYSTIGDLLSRNELTLDELNAKNEKYTVGERTFHEGNLLLDNKKSVKYWTGKYEQLVYEKIDKDIEVLRIPKTQDQQCRFECKKCKTKFEKGLRAVIHSVYEKIECPRCSKESQYTSRVKRLISKNIEVLYVPPVQNKSVEMKCKTCDSKFTLNLEGILNNYRGERKITCPYCIDEETVSKIKNGIDENIEIIHIPNLRGEKLQKSKVMLQCKKCRFKFSRCALGLIYRKQDEKTKCPECKRKKAKAE